MGNFYAADCGVRRHLSDNNLGENIWNLHRVSWRRDGCEQDVDFIKVHLNEDDNWIGKQIAQLRMPKGILVAAVKRKEQSSFQEEMCCRMRTGYSYIQSVIATMP